MKPTIDLTFTNLTKHKAFSRTFFEKIIESAIKEVRLEKKRVGLSVNLVSKAKMQALNKKYRNKDKSTDVLSFPLHNQLLPNKTKEHILELGDIFICPDVLIQKSEKSGKNLNIEMQFVTVHGFLHLLGYDHPAPSYSASHHSKRRRARSGTSELSVEAKKMFDLQNKILNKISKFT